MKRIFAAAVLSLATAASASAAAKAPTIWQGDLFVASVTSACSGINLGYFGQAIYAPAGLPGNSTTDQLVIFTPANGADPRFGAMQFAPLNGGTLNGATSVAIWSIDNQAGVHQKQGTLSTPMAISPSNISANTQTVTVSVTNFDVGNSGCAVNFQGALALRPGKLPN
ncbi:MAG: hypothetical protein ACLPX9_11185 [Rhodomicrobium sp.]